MLVARPGFDSDLGCEGGESGEAFDLREYLSSSNDANQQAGIKHKVCYLIFAVVLVQDLMTLPYFSMLV